MQPHIDYCRERVKRGSKSGAPPATPVAAAVEKALFDDNPREHYLVTGEPFEAEMIASKLFEELLNLNQGAPHNYSRERLIEIMDDEAKIYRGEKERSFGPED